MPGLPLIAATIPSVRRGYKTDRQKSSREGNLVPVSMSKYPLARFRGLAHRKIPYTMI